MFSNGSDFEKGDIVVVKDFPWDDVEKAKARSGWTDPADNGNGQSAPAINLLNEPRFEELRFLSSLFRGTRLEVMGVVEDGKVVVSRLDQDLDLDPDQSRNQGQKSKYRVSVKYLRHQKRVPILGLEF